MEDMVRKESFAALLDTEEFSSETQRKAFTKHTEWDHRDRAFYTALVGTTLDNRVVIDAVIRAYSRTRIRKMRPAVRTAVEMALAQVLFMDRVPDSAACNESIKLVKMAGDGRYTGFANGLIRNIIRHKDHLEARVLVGDRSVRLVNTGEGLKGWQTAEKEDKPLERVLNLSLSYSYPYQLVEHFIKSYGDAEQILKGLRSRRQITAFTLVPPEDIPGAHVLSDHAVSFDEGSDPASMQEFRDGLFYIMDQSSMTPVNEAYKEIKEADMILDLCASPGGKSIEAAALFGAHVTSCDVSDDKTSRITENIERLHLTDKISVRKNDATVYNPDFEKKYDIVIADVPCSAIGVSGRKPDIRQRVTKEKCADLSVIQQQIIENAARYVKDGGAIVYSTCTLDPLENEEQVSGFIERHADFTLIKQQTIMPDAGHDGFFYAIMRMA